MRGRATCRAARVWFRASALWLKHLPKEGKTEQLCEESHDGLLWCLPSSKERMIGRKQRKHGVSGASLAFIFFKLTQGILAGGVRPDVIQN